MIVQMINFYYHNNTLCELRKILLIIWDPECEPWAQHLSKGVQAHAHQHCYCSRKSSAQQKAPAQKLSSEKDVRESGWEEGKLKAQPLEAINLSPYYCHGRGCITVAYGLGKQRNVIFKSSNPGQKMHHNNKDNDNIFSATCIPTLDGVISCHA